MGTGASDQSALTSPEQIMSVLAASGDWNKVSESPNSGERNVLDSTDNILLNTNLFNALTFSPENISITADGFGPYQITVELTEVRCCTYCFRCNLHHRTHA